MIDGGNSWYRDDVDRSGPLLEQYGVHYLDVGTSGGVHGLERGYCLMVGGDAEAVAEMAPIFDTLAPGVDAAERTPGRTGEPDSRRARLAALRPVGRRPLREDGPQRDRVRADGGVRRGAQRARQGRTSGGRITPPTPRRLRSPTPAYYQYDFDLAVDHRGVAAWQRRDELAARPHRRGAARRPAARRRTPAT